MSPSADDHNAAGTGEISRLTDDLFRHEAGKLISVLTGIFGINRLQMAEDVVQEALVRALRTWPYTGVPKVPAAWLTQTAKNLALDLIRREKLFHDKEPQIIAFMEQWPAESATGDAPIFENEIKDSRLRLMFACCHPALSPEDQTALALRTAKKSEASLITSSCDSVASHLPEMTQAISLPAPSSNAICRTRFRDTKLTFGRKSGRLAGFF